MTELEKARYNASKTAKDEKAKIKQALPIDGLLSFLEGGARPRAIVGGLLNGDTTALNGLLGEIKQLVDPNYMRNVKGMSEQDAINIALDTNPIMAGTIKGNVIDAITPKTQYELAHELAQKNAVEMLGLPPNNTAMQRARALGFETAPSKELYHSSRKEWADNVVDPSQSDLGFHIGTLEQADNRAKAFGTNGVNYSDGSNFIPVMKSKYAVTLPVKDEGSFHADSIAPQFEKKKLLAKGHTKKILNHPLGESNPAEWDKVFDQQMRDVLKQNDYQGVHYNNAQEGAGNSYAITDPSVIRSRFAAFDPARAHEADLLGMTTPEMLGLLAAGSGAGVAYANSRKNKKGNNK